MTIVEIKNAGHALVPEQPKALAEAIGKFAKQQFAKNHSCSLKKRTFKNVRF